MANLNQNKTRNRSFLMIDSTDHITGKTLLTPTVTISKDAAAFAPPVGAVNEIGFGWYYVTLSPADVDTLGDLDFHATAPGADPTDWGDQVVIVVLMKNTDCNNFTFPMYNSTTHQLQPGLTVTATRTIDGAAFAPCANSVTGIGSGLYKIDLAASDLNGNVIGLLFKATGADDNPITLLTQ